MIVKKILAIINPISGTSKKNNIPQKINDILSSDDVTIDIVYTEYAGHATVLAKKAVEAGLQVKPYIRTSLSPGSGMVTHYLSSSGVLPYLSKLG